MSWATNWDGMKYDIVFYGTPTDSSQIGMNMTDKNASTDPLRCIWIHWVFDDSVLEERLGVTVH